MIHINLKKQQQTDLLLLSGVLVPMTQILFPNFVASTYVLLSGVDVGCYDQGVNHVGC